MSDQTPKQARPEELKAEQRFRDAVDREIAGFGITEISIRNQIVWDYMAHWEGRTEKAEALVATLTARCEALEIERNTAQAEADRWRIMMGDASPKTVAAKAELDTTIANLIARCEALQIKNDELLMNAKDLVRLVGEKTEQAKGWRCFYCGFVFVDPVEAREHFGGHSQTTVACRVEALRDRCIEMEIAKDVLLSDKALLIADNDRLHRAAVDLWWAGRNSVAVAPIPAPDQQLQEMCRLAIQDVKP